MSRLILLIVLAAFEQVQLNAETAIPNGDFYQCLLGVRDIRFYPGGPPIAVEGKVKFTIIAQDDIAKIELQSGAYSYQMFSIGQVLYRLRFRKACIGSTITGMLAWQPSPDDSFGLKLFGKDRLQLYGMSTPQAILQSVFFDKEKLSRIRSLKLEMRELVRHMPDTAHDTLFGEMK
jgi:hypothetical protein